LREIEPVCTTPLVTLSLPVRVDFPPAGIVALTLQLSPEYLRVITLVGTAPSAYDELTTIDPAVTLPASLAVRLIVTAPPLSGLRRRSVRQPVAVWLASLASRVVPISTIALCFTH
jgi:hypothetical protein